MLLCLGEPPVRFFFVVVVDFWCVSSFVDVLHFVFVFHFISRLLHHVTGTPPWLLRPLKVSSSSELNLDYFWLPFLFHLPETLRIWVGIFYPQTFFILRSFPTFLAQPAFIKASLGAGRSFILILKAQTQHICLFVWFTVITIFCTS